MRRSVKARPRKGARGRLAVRLCVANLQVWSDTEWPDFLGEVRDLCQEAGRQLRMLCRLSENQHTSTVVALTSGLENPGAMAELATNPQNSCHRLNQHIFLPQTPRQDLAFCFFNITDVSATVASVNAYVRPGQQEGVPTSMVLCSHMELYLSPLEGWNVRQVLSHDPLVSGSAKIVWPLPLSSRPHACHSPHHSAPLCQQHASFLASKRRPSHNWADRFARRR